MPKVDGSLGSLVQGVSQQTERNRRSGQSQEQTNIVNDEVFGMSRRGGAQLVATLDKQHEVDDTVEYGSFRDSEGDPVDYIAKTGTDSFLKLYRNGVQQTLNYTDDSEDYLVGTDDAVVGNKIVFTTLGTTTRVLNVEKEVKALPELSTVGERTHAAVWMTGINFSTTYTVTIRQFGTFKSASYRTFDGSTHSNSQYVKVDIVMKTLFELIRDQIPTSSNVDKTVTVNRDVNKESGHNRSFTNGNSFARNGILIQLVDDHILFTSTTASNDAFDITVTDGAGRNFLKVIQEETSDASKLPIRASLGHTVKVSGSELEEDDFYLRWNAFRLYEGRWVETTAPKEKFRLDSSTLPQDLTRNADGSYTMSNSTYVKRDAGDDTTNPMPSFVGTVITDMLEFQGRALYLHPSGVVLSSTYNYNDLFAQTATTSLVTDPIDVSATSPNGKNVALRYATAYQEDVVVFGTDNVQFNLSGRTILDPATVTFAPSNEFNVYLGARPLAADSVLLVTSFSGQFSRTGEIYVAGNNGEQDIRILSNHVPRYMEGEPRIFANDTGSNTSMFLNTDRRVITVYEYLWIDGERVLSAWSKWTFDEDIMHIRITDGIVHLWLIGAEGCLTVLALGLNSANTGDLDFRLHLDRLQVADATGNTLEGVLVGTPTEFPVVCRASDGVQLRVTSSEITNLSEVSTGVVPKTTLTLEKEYSGQVFVGTSFNTKYVPTMPIMRDAEDVVISGAKLNVSDFTVTFEQSNEFTMTRASYFENPEDYWTYTYSGVTLGDPDFVLGEFNMQDGKVEFPFDDQASTSQFVIDCSSPYPMALTEIEWRGLVSYRSRRIPNGN